MDTDAIRKDFPLFDGCATGNCTVYFDNACMTLRPRQVIDKLVEYYSEYPGCGGRSLHRISSRVTEEYEGARDIVSEFVNAPDRDSVVFLKNTTEAINLVAYSYPFGKGDIVLGTDHEHNSNLVPWLNLKNRGVIDYRHVPSREDLDFDIEAYADMVRSASLVSMVHVSNLDGREIPAKEIVRIAHENEVPVLLDVAQSVPHMTIDMKDLGADFIAFSGHKAMGPTGTGVLACDPDALKRLSPFLVGGDTVKETTYEDVQFLEPPKRFEAGLQDFAGFIGLGAALRYLKNIGPDRVHEHELDLNRYATTALEGIAEIAGPSDPDRRGGILPFRMEGLNSHDIAMMLDEIANIAIRSGMHCVHSWFNKRGEKTTARASFYLYNTRSEIDKMVDTLSMIKQDFL